MDSTDLLMCNALIHTMDERKPLASWMAVARGRIVALGSDEPPTAWVESALRVVDLKGAAVLPGFIDAHNHHYLAGEEDLFRVGFASTATIDEICSTVADWIESKSLEPGEWVMGGNWGSTLVAALSEPAPLAALDAVSPHNPVLLSDDSHHNRWANSAALAAAHIGDETPDPDGGRIVRDPSGHATGLLFEYAAAAVEQARLAVTGVDIDRLARSSERGVEMMHEFGITAFQDASASHELLQAMKKLDEQNRLTSWAVTSMLINDTILGNEFVGRELLALGERYRTAHHRPDFAKIYLDGVPPTHTAALLEPYPVHAEHGPDHAGGTTMSSGELEGWLRHAGTLGIGVKVHATGDASVRMVLDVVEKIRRDGVAAPVQIAHGQLVHPSDVARFAELRVIAEISPFLWYPGVIPNALHETLSPQLMDRIHPNRELLDAGALVVGGSDWPVSESPNPWHAIYGLVTRQDPTHQYPGALAPDQAMTLLEAVRAFTSSSAVALGLDDVAGSLRVGLSADFIVLSTDPFSCEVDELPKITVEQTWFAGEKVYDRSTLPL